MSMRPNTASRSLSRLSLSLGALWLQCALAQQCFYPDGSQVVAESVHQCSSDGGVCCPENWDCLSNGLCFNKAANYLGRYSCTDDSWGSSCPDFCLDNGSMGGNQAVLQCDDGRYCCDADRVSFNCCDNGAERFDLPDGGSGGSSGSTASSEPTSSAEPSPSPSPSPSPTPTSSPSSSSPPDSSESSSPATSKANNAGSSSSTSVVTSSISSSVVSEAGKPESTVIKTTVFTTAFATSAASAVPADSAATSSPPSSSHKSKTAMTLGLAIGIPLGLALILVPLLFFLFRRRRKYTLVAQERRHQEVADAYGPADKDSRPGTPAPEYVSGQYYSAKHVRAPSEIDGGTLGLHRHQPDVAELSAEPRTPAIPEDSSTPSSGTTAGATGWQPPPRSAPKLVGGRAYSHRTPGQNPDYQPYLSELPT